MPEERGSIVLFDQRHGNDTWRLEISLFRGRRFGNWRRWYGEPHELKPSRDGVTIPLERLADLHEALSDFLSPHPACSSNRKIGPVKEERGAETAAAIAYLETRER
jgi:hypothetical protein